MLDDVKFSAFLGLPLETWKGNEPKETSGDVSTWVCKWGSASTKGDKILSAEFHLNTMVCIDICGDSLHIWDIRTHSTSDVYEYCNDPERTAKSMFKCWHPLEEERIEKYLNKDIDCKLWRMVQTRALELYEGR